MMYSELIKLDRELRLCRQEAQADAASPCHVATQFQCQTAGIDIGLISPSPMELMGPVELLFVGVNPNWSLPLNAAQELAKPGTNSGKAFFAYEDHLVGAASTTMPAGSIIAHTDLVPCGTPNGAGVENVIARCRARFFDKVVRTLQPKVLIAIGSYASAHLYWYDTHPGKTGRPWGGLRKRHATSERAVFGNHECRIVFVLQPSSHVSRAKRDAARDAIAAAYGEMLE
jgi:hypothetical protein